MAAITLFLLLNPAAVAAIWRRDGHRATARDHLRAAAAGALALVVIVLISRPLLDWLDTSDATFRIAAGVLVIFGALQAFLGIGLKHRQTTVGWTAVAAALWLASPATLAATMAVRVNHGLTIGIIAGALAVLIASALGFLWIQRFGGDRSVLLGWTRRVLAAGAAASGVDLIRQGVLSI